MSGAADISIVIVSYNVKELLLKCIESVRRFSGDFSIEIIVVDNHSSDHTVGSLKKLSPGVTLIENDSNTGFSFANNQGIEASVGKFIFLLNPDTEINDNIFQMLVSESNANDNPVLAPGLMNSDGSLQVSCYKFPGLFSVIAEAFFLHKLFSVNEYPINYFSEKFYPDWASGAALFFSRDVFNKVGKLDENLFWMDDVDFCFRASKKNILTLYLPGKLICHHGGKSSQKNLSVTISNQLLSKAKYLMKHKGKMISMIALFFIFFQVVTRIVLFLFLSPFGRIYRVKFNAYFFTLGRFFNFIFRENQSIS